jgi:hypothetical protein
MLGRSLDLSEKAVVATPRDHVCVAPFDLGCPALCLEPTAEDSHDSVLVPLFLPFWRPVSHWELYLAKVATIGLWSLYSSQSKGDRASQLFSRSARASEAKR